MNTNKQHIAPKTNWFSLAVMSLSYDERYNRGTQEGITLGFSCMS